MTGGEEMKRQDVLDRLGFFTPEIKKKRVIVHSDIAAEADDQFAVVHHLLTPTEDVRGIIAANFEWKYRTHPRLAAEAGQSTEKSYQEGKTLLELMEIDDVPLLRGAADYIADPEHLPESEGADFIIQEAMRETEEPLYIALQGTLTDLAIAYRKEPKIAEHITAAIWIGGGVYPKGCEEPNLQQDVYAAQVVFDSDIPLWQIPMNVYGKSFLSFAELMTKVKPCGEIGKHLVDTMFAVNDWYGKVPLRLEFPHGEVWSIGDQPTVSVLLQSTTGSKFHYEQVGIADDMTYVKKLENRPIKVYDDIDMRLTLEDFYAKLQCCFKDPFR